MSADNLQFAGAIGCTTVTLATGVTLAQYFPMVAGRFGSEIRYVSGGSLLVIGVAEGASLTGTSLTTAGAYLCSTTFPVQVSGPAQFYLAAVGATVVATVMNRYSHGITTLV